MEKNYRAELVGVFGNPVDENPTGVIEEAAFAAKNLPFRYITYKVEESGLDTAMKAIRDLNMRGINLTIPHKVAAVAYMDELSQAAEIIGAVNVVVNRDGILWGENTDGKGFLKSLTDENISVKGKTVTVLGAGGASRAISVECALAGAKKVNIVNHSKERGETLTNLLAERTDADAEFHHWEGTFRIPAETEILINATSVGLYPNIDQRPDICYEDIRSDMVVCDVIFNRPHSLFLQGAEKQGAKTINGLGMLVNQAAVNFELWTGEKAPIELMKEVLEKEFGLA